MHKPRVIALTGGIGSGKSRIADLFSAWGASVVDADQLAREVVAPGTLGCGKIVETFGKGILGPDGAIDRKKLGALVFSDPSKRKELEAIVHPLVRSAWLARLDALIKEAPPLIVYAVPLLFESGMSYPEIEKIVLVTAPEASRVQRIMLRDGISESEARSRMSAQFSDEEKAARCDFVIANDGSISELESKVRPVFDTVVR